MNPTALLTHLTQSMGARAVDLEVSLAATRTELDAAKAEIVQLRQQLDEAHEQTAKTPESEKTS